MKKPAYYHWRVYAKDGSEITICELHGGRDRAKRIRKGQAAWPHFGSFSRIKPGQFKP